MLDFAARKMMYAAWNDFQWNNLQSTNLAYDI